MSLFSKTRARAVTAIALASICAASAQFSAPTNARVDALAGARVSDISGIYRYPVVMTGYLDHIQATWGQGFVGIKSVSDKISFGVLANQGPMDTAFTRAAAGALTGYFNTPAAPPPPPQPPQTSPPQGTGAAFNNDSLFHALPHLLLGFDLGAAAIGADVFFEYAGYGATRDATVYSGSVMNPGAKVSGKFGVAGAEVMAKFGVGFPSVSASGAPGKDNLSSDKGLYMEAGAEAGIPVGGTDWVAGLCYTQSAYRFKTGNTLDADAITNSLLNVYAGVEFNFVETAVAALGYSFSRAAKTTDQPDVSGSPSSTAPVNITHGIYAGVENAWEKAWIFDSFQLRGGALYTLATTGGKTSPPATAADEEFSQPAVHSTVSPVLGVSVSKAFLTFDVSLNPGEWGGLFTGPDVAWATLTVKF